MTKKYTSNGQSVKPVVVKNNYNNFGLLNSDNSDNDDDNDDDNDTKDNTKFINESKQTNTRIPPNDIIQTKNKDRSNYNNNARDKSESMTEQNVNQKFEPQYMPREKEDSKKPYNLPTDKTEKDKLSKKENNSVVTPHNKQASIYEPPVTMECWNTSQRRRRHDNSDNSERSSDHPMECKEDTNNGADKLEYYTGGKMPGDEMKLNTTWTVWVHENDNKDWSISSYKSIYVIDSIGSMWRFLWILDNLNKNVRQYYIMRNGITPIWEDNNNKQGAICSIMIDKMNSGSRHARGDLGVDAFSAICVLVMNESFVKNNQDINGLCYTIKSRSALIKLWVKDYETNSNFIEKLPIGILKCLDTIIADIETKGNVVKSRGKSKISVQIKQIKPDT